jgi:hypothetical protein
LSSLPPLSMRRVPDAGGRTWYQTVRPQAVVPPFGRWHEVGSPGSIVAAWVTALAEPGASIGAAPAKPRLASGRHGSSARCLA